MLTLATPGEHLERTFVQEEVTAVSSPKELGRNRQMMRKTENDNKHHCVCVCESVCVCWTTV